MTSAAPAAYADREPGETAAIPHTGYMSRIRVSLQTSICVRGELTISRECEGV